MLLRRQRPAPPHPHPHPHPPHPQRNIILYCMKHRAAPWPCLFVEFWSQHWYLYSANMSTKTRWIFGPWRVILVTFRGHVGAFGSHCGSMLALGVPKRPKAPQSQILATFWAPFGSPRGALLRSFWHFFFAIGGIMSTFWCPFSGRGKRSKNGAPQGGGHAIRSRRRMFRESRPSSRRLHFGLHFWSILGGQVGTILLWGRPEMQTTYPEARVNFEYVSKQDESRMGVQRDRVPPPRPENPGHDRTKSTRSAGTGTGN